MGKNPSLGDGDTLHLLDRAAAGVSAGVIAAEIGITRSAVLGLLFRIRKDMERVPDLATRPANCDGGMSRHWWKTGLARQRNRRGGR